MSFENDRDEVKDLARDAVKKCYNCCCWQKDEVEQCLDNVCSLHKWRFAVKVTRGMIVSWRAEYEKPCKNIEQK